MTNPCGLRKLQCWDERLNKPCNLRLKSPKSWQCVKKEARTSSKRNLLQAGARYRASWRRAGGAGLGFGDYRAARP